MTTGIAEQKEAYGTMAGERIFIFGIFFLSVCVEKKCIPKTCISSYMSYVQKQTFLSKLFIER